MRLSQVKMGPRILYFAQIQQAYYTRTMIYVVSTSEET